MENPTVFLSSTIYDFRDLRSSIKDYLELKGYQVLASDFNDFTKSVEKHSYQACLDSIEKADLFILLIGSRVGGMYDEINNISITRAEYRKAYQLALEGRIKIVSFVRSDVWVYRESTKELAKFLEAEDLVSVDDRVRINNRPTKFMTDAENINAFIDEVSRSKETSAASKGESSAPIANWLHIFSSFADIRQVVDPLILRGLSTRDAAGRRALQALLLGVIRRLLPRFKSGGFMPSAAIRSLAARINLRADSIGSNVQLSSDDWGKLVMLGTMASRTALDTTPFQSILGTDLLLSYDPKDGSYSPTLEYDALAELIDKMSQFNSARKRDWAELLKYGRPRGDIAVPAHLVATEITLLFAWASIVETAKALALSMNGSPLVLPPPMPRSAFLDQETSLADEEISMSEVRAFVGL